MLGCACFGQTNGMVGKIKILAERILEIWSHHGDESVRLDLAEHLLQKFGDLFLRL